MPKSKFLTEQDTIYSTESVKATAELGDIKIGDDLQNKSIKEILKAIIQPYRKPSLSNFSVKDNKGAILEKGDNIQHDINSISFTVKYYSDIVTKYKITAKRNSDNPVTIVSDTPIESSEFDNNQTTTITITNISFNKSSIEQTDSDSDDTITYTLSVTDNADNSMTAKAYHYYIRPYYWGTYNGDINDIVSSIRDKTYPINEVFNKKNIKTFSVSTKLEFICNTSNTDYTQKYSYIIYPKTYKYLTKTILESTNQDQRWELIKFGDNDYCEINSIKYYVYISDTSNFGKASYIFSAGGDSVREVL